MPKPSKVKILRAKCLRKSEMAFLFTSDEAEESFWLPASQIYEPDESDIYVGWEGEIKIPEWLARAKGIDL